MAPPSIFYHYTSKEGLAGILASNKIFCSTPHPATPGLLGGYVIKNGVFLTRMDPNNSKTAIAFNNYSGGGDGTNNLKKVEAYIAISIIPGSHLVEESVKDGLHGFRNIVCWRSGDLNLTNNPLVKKFWFGTVENVEELEDSPDTNQQSKAHPDRRLSDPCLALPLPVPCITPHSCKENQSQEGSRPGSLINHEKSEKAEMSKDKMVKKSRAVKRPLEELADDPVQAESLWINREILEWY